MAKPRIRFSIVGILAFTTICALVIHFSLLAGIRASWGTLSVIGLAGLGVAIALTTFPAFGYALTASSLVTLPAYSVAITMPEPQDGIPIAIAAIMLWIAGAIVTFRLATVWQVVQMAAGLTWGLMATLFLLFSIENWQFTPNWSLILPAIVIHPTVFAGSWLILAAIRNGVRWIVGRIHGNRSQR